MKLVKCKDCGDSKEILIEINSFDQTFQCKVCYNEQHSTNYFLRKQEELNEKPNLFEYDALAADMGNTAAANDKGNYLLMFFDYNTLNLSHRIKNHASWKMQNGSWSF